MYIWYLLFALELIFYKTKYKLVQVIIYLTAVMFVAFYLARITTNLYINNDFLVILAGCVLVFQAIVFIVENKKKK